MVMLRSSSVLKRTVCTPDIAFTTVDFPWATCPMVPTLMVACRLICEIKLFVFKFHNAIREKISLCVCVLCVCVVAGPLWTNKMKNETGPCWSNIDLRHQGSAQLVLKHSKTLDLVLSSGSFWIQTLRCIFSVNNNLMNLLKKCAVVVYCFFFGLVVTLGTVPVRN